MKILYVIGQLSYGGAERQIYELTRRLLQKKQYEVSVVSLSSDNEPYKKRLEDAGIPVYEVPRGRSFDFSRVRGLRQLIYQIQPDLLHCYLENATNYTFFATLFSRYTYLAAVRNASKNRGFIRYILDRISYRFARCVTVNSLALQNYCVKKLGIPADKITVIYNFIDFQRLETDYTAQVEKIRQELGINPEDRVIGTVGRLAPQKNPFLFLGLAREIACKRQEVKFLVVGDGVLRNELLKAGEELIDSKRLFYVGQKPHPEYYMKVMDIFLLTSDFEGFPNVVLEAMTAGVPVISTPIEGIQEFIRHNQTGFIAHPEKQSFISHIESLLDDKRLAEQIAVNAGRDIRETFQEQVLLRKFEALYQRYSIRKT